MSPSRALRLAVEKAADEDLSIAMRVGAIGRSQEDHAGVLDLVQDGVLLLLLDGPVGALGLMTVDPATLTSLIEMQTTGQITARPVPPRALTRTDAVLVAPLVDGILRRAAQHLVDHPDSHWMQGFRFGAMIEDRRSLGLALVAPDYHVLQLPLDIAQGARTGEVILALPVRDTPKDQTATSGQVTASAELQARILEAPACLEAVLCRLSLPLSEMGRLCEGTLLPLPPDALHEISLEAGGRVVAKANLGKSQGMRALRLKMPGQTSMGHASKELANKEHGEAQGRDQTGGAEPKDPTPSVVHRPARHFDQGRLQMAGSAPHSGQSDANKSIDPSWSDQSEGLKAALDPFDDEPMADQAFGAYAGRVMDKGPEAA